MKDKPTAIDKAADAYANLWFDFDQIGALPPLRDLPPELYSYNLSVEYTRLSGRMEKEGLTEPWHVAHLDAFMLLYLFKYGAILKDTARRLAASGHVSIYRIDFPDDQMAVEVVKLLPKGLASVMKSFEDNRVAMQIFPMMSDVTYGDLEENDDIYFFIEAAHGARDVWKRIFAEELRPKEEKAKLWRVV